MTLPTFSNAHRLAIQLALRLALGAIPGLLLWSAQAAPVKVADVQGHVLQWDAPPRRIVSLMPSLTESICALGACDRLVGVDRYSNYPAQVNQLPKLGGIDDTQVETIVALRPDVVVVTPYSRVQDRLSALGLKVLVLETRSQEDVQRGFQTLGQMLAVPDALQVWHRIEADMNAKAADVPASLRGMRVYFEVDSAPYAAGESSFIGEILGQLGLRNVVGRELGPFPKLNPEFVVRANPQIIMVGQRNVGGMDGRPGWRGIDALQAQRLCVFAPEESELITRPGPRMAEAAGLIVQCLRRLDPAAPGPGKTRPRS
ncbi:MAG: ABC transporter substrate-binding protein [Burkholderiaceae bacterium]|nr:ABC transporter substrate-binding protein [Roseateles sp.]MBV8469092.1 ABC transporter substrate-binding protein [Burkholderiaceae bacterium]